MRKQALEREREALEQQTATAEILRVISSTPTDTRPVFEAIVQSALRMFDGMGVGISLLEGERVISVAEGGHLARARGFGEIAMALDRASAAGRAIMGREVINIPDIEAPDAPEFARARGRAAGFRAIAAAPMLRQGAAVGAILIMREFPGPLSDKELQLLKTFADQAVIAIENVRLFNETKESLEQQTATADILRVISGSLIDTQPVFDAIVQSAVRLFHANRVRLFLVEGDRLQLRSRHGPGTFDGDEKNVVSLPLNGSLVGDAILKCEAIQFPDLDRLENASAEVIARNRSFGIRSTSIAPLVRDGRAIGAITVPRGEPGALSDKQMALLKTFADQAVIAIENVRLFNETKEALERQTATGEILRVISSSVEDAAPVFDAIVSACSRLFQGHAVGINLVENGRGKLLAAAGAAKEALEQLQFFADESVSARSEPDFRLKGRTVQFADVREPGVPESVGRGLAIVGANSAAFAPLRFGPQTLGCIWVGRQAAGPFSDKELALLQSFADQAVIAIKNARLFNETKEALDQQSAIREVLAVISNSPTDVQPVLDAVASRAAHICEAFDTLIFLREGDHIRPVAHFGDIPSLAIGKSLPIGRDMAAGRAILDRVPVHIEDLTAMATQEWRRALELQQQSRHGTMLAVPLMREERALGAIVLRRMEVRPFTEKQIALLKTFADQAAIAIENARLFNETKEALERQTATSDVLAAISGAQTDVGPVFEAIARNAQRLCAAVVCNVLRYDGEMLHVAASYGFSPEQETKLREKYPVKAGDASVLSGRVIATRRIEHIEDAQADPAYDHAHAANVAGWRRMLGVPMLRDDIPLGVIVVAWRDPGKTPDSEVELLKTFAAQAAIAIENVRLFNETKEALEHQTATSGILGAISSSPTDTAPVFEAIARSGLKLFSGTSITVLKRVADVVDIGAMTHIDADRAQRNRANYPVPLSREYLTGMAILDGALTDVADVDNPAPGIPAASVALVKKNGYQAITVAPMMSAGVGIGAIAVGRDVPGRLSEKQIALLRTFADQAVIAVQNAQLFKQIQEKSAQLEVASQHKSQFLASMSHELRTPLNALLGFNEMILGDIYGEVPTDMRPPLAQMQASGQHLLRLINNVLDLAKIEAGRMELALSDYSVHDTVEGVRSTLQPLAVDKGLDFIAAVPEDIPVAYGDAGRITQCLMNLAGNALKFTKAGKVEISVARNGDWLRYCVADSGVGIPPEKIEALFTEFKQTDATIASEYGGTGLGLSITKKFVEMHGGRIWVDSEPGRGSMFSFELPLRVPVEKAA